MGDVTAASHPIQLAGKEYQLSPLSDKDIVELDHYLQSQVIQMAARGLPEDASQKVLEAAMAAAVREASRLTWFSEDGAAKMRSLDGVARIVWQSLKRRHPELTHDDVRAMITDPKTVAYAMTMFRQANPTTRRDPDQGSPKARSARPRNRSTRSSARGTKG